MEWVISLRVGSSVRGVCTCVLRAATTAVLLRDLLILSPRQSHSLPQASSVVLASILGRWQGTGRQTMAGAAAPKRQDTRKFFENLSGAGKSIAVLTSGGDAQGNVAWQEFRYRTVALRGLPFTPLLPQKVRLITAGKLTKLPIHVFWRYFRKRWANFDRFLKATRPLNQQL